MAVGCFSLLAVAWSLQPSASHYGTHQQLGLEACPFLMRTRLPCPTCGMTTSMSATIHADVILAWQANPAGIVLLLASVVLAVTATIEAISGRDFLAALRLQWWAYGLVVGLPAAWMLRLAVGLASGALPLR